MSAATPGRGALSPAFARWYRIGLPLAADDVLAAAWAYQHEAERTFWAEVDAAQEPKPAPGRGKQIYETWRAAVPDFVCNVPGGEWKDLPETIRAGFDAIAAQETHAAPLWPDGAPVRDADGEDEPKAAPGLVAAYDAKVNYDALVTIGIVLKHAKDDAEAVRVTAAIIADALQGKGPEPQPAPELDDTRKRAAAAERELAELGGRLGTVVRAAADAERKRIRELADRNGAVCTGAEGTSFYFSALLADKPGEATDA